jgi:ParB-like chromosome segregation protein Spo0J
MIPCIIIPAERSSVFRQAKENTARSGLSAIAMARQAALLLLTVHGYDVPSHAVSNDFYRQALELDLRGKREYTDAVLSAMGGVNKSQFSRYKSLLHLADEALELADRHNIEEYRLRYVAAVPVEYHTEIVRQIIDFNLTTKQVKELCESDGGEADNADELEKLPIQAVKMAKVTKSISTTKPQDLARALIQQEGDATVARARLQALRKLIVEAEHYLGAE